MTMPATTPMPAVMPMIMMVDIILCAFTGNEAFSKTVMPKLATTY